MILKTREEEILSVIGILSDLLDFVLSEYIDDFNLECLRKELLDLLKTVNKLAETEQQS